MLIDVMVFGTPADSVPNVVIDFATATDIVQREHPGDGSVFPVGIDSAFLLRGSECDHSNCPIDLPQAVDSICIITGIVCAFIGTDGGTISVTFQAPTVVGPPQVLASGYCYFTNPDS
jgi:hypothetical protein